MYLVPQANGFCPIFTYIARASASALSVSPNNRRKAVSLDVSKPKLIF